MLSLFLCGYFEPLSQCVNPLTSTVPV